MNRDDADVVLLAGDVAIRVHSFILCPRSKFFEAAINGQFKVSEGIPTQCSLVLEADVNTGGRDQAGGTAGGQSYPGQQIDTMLLYYGL